MTKAHLIEKMVEKAKTLNRRDAEKVVNGIFDSIRGALKRGEKTEIRGFGSFRLRIRRTKDGRNPKTGETVSVPEKRMPFFKAGKEIKELLNVESAAPQSRDLAASPGKEIKELPNAESAAPQSRDLAAFSDKEIKELPNAERPTHEQSRPHGDGTDLDPRSPHAA